MHEIIEQAAQGESQRARREEALEDNLHDLEREVGQRIFRWGKLGRRRASWSSIGWPSGSSRSSKFGAEKWPRCSFSDNWLQAIALSALL